MNSIALDLKSIAWDVKSSAVDLKSSAEVANPSGANVMSSAVVLKIILSSMR